MNRREAISTATAAAIAIGAPTEPAKSNEIKQMPFIDGPVAGAVSISAKPFDPTFIVRRSAESKVSDLYVLTDLGYTYVGEIPND